jgi:hypothetical protein
MGLVELFNQAHLQVGQEILSFLPTLAMPSVWQLLKRKDCYQLNSN